MKEELKTGLANAITILLFAAFLAAMMIASAKLARQSGLIPTPDGGDHERYAERN